MKKSLFLFAILPILLSFVLPSDGCSSLLFFKEGTSMTLTSYSDDDKLLGSSKTVYTKVTKTATGAEVEANQESFDKKGKSQGKSNFTLKCINGTLLFDLKMMLDDKQADAYKDFEMTVEGTDKEIPSNLSVGTTLKDADVKFSFRTKEGTPFPMMNMSIRVFNRKVEAIETVTSPAGTWECFKLSEEMEMKGLVKIKGKSISWFNYEAGMVKTESYNSKCKLTGKTVLTELVKGK
jgi:hypothetical protein